METCPVCQQLVDRCVCCPECGHVCLLDLGEAYCPVCKPEPEEQSTPKSQRLFGDTGVIKATIEGLKKIK